ncbi:MAG TPA: helix-turn-helix transcriptional regulator [Candidatus Angelobacter sp.]|nr:helix-turn-helix transcriptional regulator [Candidatus Angelobacter sp.]
MSLNFTPDFAYTIRRQRQRRGMSQAELGRLLHMPQSQVARIEKGSSDMRLSTVAEIARVLDLEPMLLPKRLVPAVRYMIENPTESTPMPKLVGNEPEDVDE